VGSGGILILALDGVEWSASWPCRFTPGEKALGIYCIGGWVGPTTSHGINCRCHSNVKWNERMVTRDKLERTRRKGRGPFEGII